MLLPEGLYYSCAEKYKLPHLAAPPAVLLADGAAGRKEDGRTQPRRSGNKAFTPFFLEKMAGAGQRPAKTVRALRQYISLHTAPVEAARCAVQEIGTLPRAEGLGDAGAFAGRFNGEAQAGKIDFRQF